MLTFDFDDPPRRRLPPPTPSIAHAAAMPPRFSRFFFSPFCRRHEPLPPCCLLTPRQFFAADVCHFFSPFVAAIFRFLPPRYYRSRDYAAAATPCRRPPHFSLDAAAPSPDYAIFHACLRLTSACAGKAQLRAPALALMRCCAPIAAPAVPADTLRLPSCCLRYAPRRYVLRDCRHAIFIDDFTPCRFSPPFFAFFAAAIFFVCRCRCRCRRCRCAATPPILPTPMLLP